MTVENKQRRLNEMLKKQMLKSQRALFAKTQNQLVNNRLHHQLKLSPPPLSMTSKTKAW